MGATTTWQQRLRRALPTGVDLPEDTWNARHRAILTLVWAHVVIIPLLALWQGRTLGHIALDVAPIVGLALAASLPTAPRGIRASLTTLALVGCSAVLVHVFGGLIELHFHFFVVIAIVSLYQRWTPYLLGVGFVLLHHAVIGTLAPTAVYNHAAAIAHPVTFAIVHGSFVLAESIACLAYWKASEATVLAERQARERTEKAHEALAEAHAEISDLLGMLSHDLRTPLTAIAGFASVLQRRGDSLSAERRAEILRRIDTASRHLQSMLDDTLSLTELDSHGPQPEPTRVRLDEVLRDAVDLSALSPDEVDLSGVRPVEAYADRGHLVQVLANLLTNAQKYGAAPYAATTDTLDGRSVVTVADHGDGVPPEFVDRLFDRFARADLHRRGPVKGTGLGLYISRRLALANGGDLRHHEAPGGGALFVVDLPASPATAPGPRSSVAPSGNAGALTSTG